METVVLLPVASVLTHQCGQNTTLISQRATGTAQRGAGLLYGVILFQTFSKEVAQSIGSMSSTN
jgi:hypothetical protein